MSAKAKYVLGRRFYTGDINPAVFLREKLEALGFKVSDFSRVREENQSFIRCTLGSSVSESDWNADPAVFWHLELIAKNGLAYLIEKCNGSMGLHLSLLLGSPKDASKNARDFELVLKLKTNIDTFSEGVSGLVLYDMLKFAQALDLFYNEALNAEEHNWVKQLGANANTTAVPPDYMCDYVTVYKNYQDHNKAITKDVNDYPRFTNPDIAEFDDILHSGKLDIIPFHLKCNDPQKLAKLMVIANHCDFMAHESVDDGIVMVKRK